MKKIFLLSILFLIFIIFDSKATTISKSRVAKSRFVVAASLEDILVSTVWKIDQLYVDSMRLNNAQNPEFNFPVFDSITYTFDHGSNFTLSNGTHDAFANWEITYLEDGTPQVTIVDYDPEEGVNGLIQTMNIVYYDDRHLIFTITQLEEGSDNTWHTIEYRMIPIDAEKCN